MRTCHGEVVKYVNVFLYYFLGNTKEQLNTDAWSWFKEERRGGSKCLL